MNKLILNNEKIKYFDKQKEIIDKINEVNLNTRAIYLIDDLINYNVISNINNIKITLFTDKKNIKLDFLKDVKDINISLEKYNIDNLKNTYFPEIYDFLLNSFIVYGDKIETHILNYLKSLDINNIKEQTVSFFNSLNYKIEKNYNNKELTNLRINLFRYYRCLLNLNFIDDKNHSKFLEYYDNIEDLFSYFKILQKEVNNLDYSFIFKRIKEIDLVCGQAAGVILYNKKTNKFLILEHSFRGGGWWAFPKGGIEKNETHIDTIKREVFEETGITNLEIKDYLYQTNHYYYCDSNKIRKTKPFFYLAITEETNVVVSEEHLSYKWLDVSEINKYIKPNNLLHILYLANNVLK